MGKLAETLVKVKRAWAMYFVTVSLFPIRRNQRSKIVETLFFTMHGNVCTYAIK